MKTVLHEVAAPVVKAASYFLAHVPSLVRYGSKPSRDLAQTQPFCPALWTTSVLLIGRSIMLLTKRL
jgi:hypothetical protein